jgi:NTE family protein
MAREQAASRRRPRIGLVLGAGGVLGAAWLTGALAALQERLPCPVAEVDLLVGTSAGSVLAAALRCGIRVDELVAHQRGTPPCVLSRLCSPDLGCTPLPSWPKLTPGSPKLLLAALRTPRKVHPWVTAAACLPQGRAEHGTLRSVVDGLLTHARQRAAAASGHTWITAVDYDSGQRVAFGRPGAPQAGLPDAVVASCSVPGWYRPAVIGGRRYVDGGVRSGTNADLLVGAGLSQVYVLAPAASLVTDIPRAFGERVERWIRRFMTAALLWEIGPLADSGSDVVVLTPGPQDLRAMGGNLMDNRRRRLVFETALWTSAAALDGKPPAVPAPRRPVARWGWGVPRAPRVRAQEGP